MTHNSSSPRDNNQEQKEKQKVDYAYENTSQFNLATPIRFSREYDERTYVEFMMNKSAKVDKLATVTSTRSAEFNQENLTAKSLFLIETSSKGLIVWGHYNLATIHL